jgi:hypothetical protein
MELAKSGTPVLQNLWNNRVTYVAYENGEWFFHTYLDLHLGQVKVCIEHIEEEIARFALTARYDLD